jgi:flagellar protein FlaG
MDMDMSVKLSLSYPAPPVGQIATELPLDKTNVLPEPDQASDGEPDREALHSAVNDIQMFVQTLKRNLEFSIDDTSGRVVVKVIASDSGEVVRQIPSETVLKLAHSLSDASSLLFSAET